jgi:hypothetical protein
MLDRLGTSAGVVLGTLLIFASPALADHSPEITDDEAKCQQGASLGLAKFVKKKWQCIVRCERRASNGLIDPSECVPPYLGETETADCIHNVAVSKATDQFGAKCTKDCPECYAGGVCSAFADTKIAELENQVDVLKGLIYCDDSGSPDGLTGPEARCQKKVALILRNFGFNKMRCLRKCRKREHKGRTKGSCDPLDLGDDLLADANTKRCVDRQTAKAAILIDRKCRVPAGDFPECGLTSGSAWADLVELNVDGLDPQLFCVDPSPP